MIMRETTRKSEAKMHKNIQECESCLEKLKGCHPDIVNFFSFVKSKHIDAHISWGYRDQVDQDNFFAKGLSDDKWPNSKHNRTENGLPKSEALDLFQLVNGTAHFPLSFYETIYREIQAENLKIEAGLTWHKPDSDHFQLA